MRPDPIWRRLLRYLSILLLAGPLAGLTLVWATVSILSLTPDRNRIIDLGDKIMAGLLVLAGIGLILEFLIVPLLLAEPKRRRPPAETVPDNAGSPPADDLRKCPPGPAAAAPGEDTRS